MALSWTGRCMLGLLGGRGVRRASSLPLPPHKLVPLVMLSPTMTHGTILKWNVAPGGHVPSGEVLYEVRAEKLTEAGATVDMLVESQDEGYLAAVFAGAGARVPVGAPVAVLCEEAADTGRFADFAPPAAALDSDFAYWAYAKHADSVSECSVSQGKV
eukprot:EG_transcript_24341